MSKKILRVEGIANELEGASLFFNPPSKPNPTQVKYPSTGASPSNHERHTPLKGPGRDDTLHKQTRMHASKHTRMNESMHDGKHVSMNASMHESKHVSMYASKHESMHSGRQIILLKNEGGDQASTHERMHASQQDDFIETIRKSIKKVGREELYVRLTSEEKNEIRSVVHEINELYRGKGGKTSENEVSRIALKLLLEDYKNNGEQSILSITQEALNA